MKKLTAIASILALGITLTACGAGGQLDEPDKPAAPAEPKTLDDGGAWQRFEEKLYAQTVKLADGREITCIILADQVKDTSIGGLSCDWETAYVEETPR